MVRQRLTGLAVVNDKDCGERSQATNTEDERLQLQSAPHQCHIVSVQQKDLRPQVVTVGQWLRQAVRLAVERSLHLASWEEVLEVADIRIAAGVAEMVAEGSAAVADTAAGYC